jgi:hypothetical protein
MKRKPATKPAPAAVAAWMNRPLVPRAKPPADAAGKEAAAMEELLSCVAALQRGFVLGEDALPFLVFEAAKYGAEWLAARAMSGDAGASAKLIHLRAAIDAALNGIPPQIPAGKVAQGTARALKARRAPVGSPMGGPKMNFTKPDNRTALELFGRIEAYRERWRVIQGNTAAKAKLYPIPAACVALDDFGPATWRAWHEVGKLMLRADGCSAGSHLAAAWQRLAKVHDSMPLTSINWT